MCFPFQQRDRHPKEIIPFIKPETADYPTLLAQPDPNKPRPKPFFESLDWSQKPLLQVKLAFAQSQPHLV
jgi:hypothetical protein